MTRSWSLLLFVWTSVSMTTPCFAIDETTRIMLRDLSVQGVKAYEQARYDEAVEKLERSWSILQTAPLGLWSARALTKVGRLVEASERYLAAARAPLDPGGDADAQARARGEATEEWHALRTRIPNITVTVQGAAREAVQLSLNGQQIRSLFIGSPIPVNPGQVSIVALVADQRRERVLHVVEGQSVQVELSFLQPVPSLARPTQARVGEAQSTPPEDRAPVDSGPGGLAIAGWTILGAGAASLATGVVTGVMVLDKWKKWDCTNDAGCNASASETTDLNTLRTVSTVTLLLGGVLTATGAVLLITDYKSKNTARAGLVPYVGWSSVGLVGHF